MKLFTLDCDYIEGEAIESIIDTPLGLVTTYIKFSDYIVDDQISKDTIQLETGARITTFYSQDFEAELLTCRPDYYIHHEQKLLDCWAFLWRFKPSKFIHEPSFMVKWKEQYKWTESGYEGGENLVARSFSDNDYVVLIGTQDDDMLRVRAEVNDYIPKKFIDMVNGPYVLVSDFNEGIEVPMPDLEPNDICQIHFIVAWNNNIKDEVATWYAVDCFPEFILDIAGVK